MNDYSWRLLARKIEPVIVIFLLLYYFDPQLPTFLTQIAKYVSYALVTLLFGSVCLRQLPRLAYLVTRDLFPWLLLGLGVASVLWSAAPEYTLDEIDPVISATFFGAYLAMRYSLTELMKLVAWTIGLAALFSLVYLITFPALSVEDGLVKGIFQHKQYLGRTMTVGTVAFLNVILSRQLPANRRWLPVIGILMTLTLILLSQSRSSMLLLGLSLGLLPAYNFVRQRYRIQVFIFMPLFLLAASASMLVIDNLEFIVVDILGKNMEFNGRTPIWTLAIEKCLERPWFGYGYAGFWTSDSSAHIINSTWAPNDVRFHSHNGFIDICLQLGIVGLLILLIHFFLVIKRVIFLISTTQSRALFWSFQFLLIFFLANLSIVNTFLVGNTAWILYLAICFSTGLELDRWKRQKILSDRKIKELKRAYVSQLN